MPLNPYVEDKSPDDDNLGDKYRKRHCFQTTMSLVTTPQASTFLTTTLLHMVVPEDENIGNQDSDDEDSGRYRQHLPAPISSLGPT